MNIAVVGTGAMGSLLASRIEKTEDLTLTALVDHLSKASQIFKASDVLIDFSHPSNLEAILEYGIKTNTPLVIATTGFDDSDLESIREASENIPILFTRNTSLGINVLSEILMRFSSVLEEFDIEVIEKHHNQKLDAPSGTAKMLVNSIKSGLGQTYETVNGREGMKKRSTKEIGVHAIRGGTIVGEHSVLYAGNDEIIELKHTSLSKEVYVTGALKAARFLIENEKGLYSMKDVIDLRR